MREWWCKVPDQAKEDEDEEGELEDGRKLDRLLCISASLFLYVIIVDANEPLIETMKTESLISLRFILAVCLMALISVCVSDQMVSRILTY